MLSMDETAVFLLKEQNLITSRLKEIIEPCMIVDGGTDVLHWMAGGAMCLGKDGARSDAGFSHEKITRKSCEECLEKLVFGKFPGKKYPHPIAG